MAIHSLVLAATMASAANVSAVHLGPNDFCAGSPLVVGTTYRGATVTDIHTLDRADGPAVGWIYTMSTGPSFLQANQRMSLEDQKELNVSAGESLSEPRVRPERLPVDLEIQPCKPSQVSVY
jgi:hypothetical protein